MLLLLLLLLLVRFTLIGLLLLVVEASRLLEHMRRRIWQQGLTLIEHELIRSVIVIVIVVVVIELVRLNGAVWTEQRCLMRFKVGLGGVVAIKASIAQRFHHGAFIVHLPGVESRLVDIGLRARELRHV